MVLYQFIMKESVKLRFKNKQIHSYFILISYVLKITTITRYTLSIGPFILRETDKVEEVEWK
jgi:hypothetical protein